MNLNKNDYLCENIKIMENKSVEFQLGLYIGEYIINNCLPTLNIDTIKTNRIINISSDEFKKYEQLDTSWINKCFQKKSDGSITDSTEWINLVNFHQEMKLKYITENLNCYVPYFDVENKIELIKGISESLLYSDLSHYSTDIKDIIIEEKKENSINVKRRIKLIRNEKI